MRKRIWLNIFIACLAISGTALCQSPVTLTIPYVPSNRGFKIPDDYTGLSFGAISELPNHAGVSGHLWSANNKQVVNLFRNSGIHNLRLGGSTVEGLDAAVPTRVDIDSVFAFAKAADIKVIYSLRLLNGDAGVSASVAKYVWDNYRQYVDYLAIGNEPDIRRYHYPPNGSGTDPRIIGDSSYLKLWRKFAAAVLDSVPGAKFAGPDAAGRMWAVRFANDEKNIKNVKLITQHLYVGGTPHINGLSPRTKPTPPYIPVDSAVNNMLSKNWVDNKYPEFYKQTIAPVLNDGFAYRMTESDDYLRGVPNASDAFASALWALDYLHWFAVHDCSGVNLHNTMWVYTDTICRDSTGSFQINPRAYAIKAFDFGGHGRVTPVKIENPDSINLTAYAVRGTKNLYVTIINKEHGGSAREANVKINSTKGTGKASAMFLTAPNNNVLAKTGITLGGSSITNHSKWQGKWTLIYSKNSCGLTIVVPPTSAVVVKISFK
jgi:hypothetical protein